MSNSNKRSYTVYINSKDKMPGNKNNNATYQINWDDFLDRKYNIYKLYWNLTTSADEYVDESIATGFTSAIVNIDFGCKTYSFDTGIKGSSSCIGYIYRDSLDNTTFPLNYFSCSHLQNAPKMLNRPTQNFITVSIINAGDGVTPLTSTISPGLPNTDMSNYYMQLEFIPVEDSKI